MKDAKEWREIYNASWKGDWLNSISLTELIKRVQEDAIFEFWERCLNEAGEQGALDVIDVDSIAKELAGSIAKVEFNTNPAATLPRLPEE